MPNPEIPDLSAAILALTSSVIGGTIVAIISYFSQKRLARHSAELARRNDTFSRTFATREKGVQHLHQMSLNIYQMLTFYPKTCEAFYAAQDATLVATEEILDKLVRNLQESAIEKGIYLTEDIKRNAGKFVLCATAILSIYRHLIDHPGEPAESAKQLDSDLKQLFGHLRENLEELINSFDAVVGVKI